MGPALGLTPRLLRLPRLCTHCLQVNIHNWSSLLSPVPQITINNKHGRQELLMATHLLQCIQLSLYCTLEINTFYVNYISIKKIVKRITKSRTLLKKSIPNSTQPTNKNQIRISHLAGKLLHQQSPQFYLYSKGAFSTCGKGSSFLSWFQLRGLVGLGREMSGDRVVHTWGLGQESLSCQGTQLPIAWEASGCGSALVPSSRSSQWGLREDTVPFWSSVLLLSSEMIVW